MNANKLETENGRKHTAKDVTLFVDWGKVATILRDEKIFKVDFDEFSELLERKAKDYNITIVVETGCPTYFLLKALKNRVNVYQIEGRTVSDYREKSNMKKSDETDVHILKELFEKDKSLFRKVEDYDRPALEKKYLERRYLAISNACASFKVRNKALKRNGREGFIH